MKKFYGLLLVVVVLFSSQSFAESLSGPYLVLETGTLRYAGLVPPSGTEAEILNTPGVTGSYEVDDKSTYTAFGFGWRFNKFITADVARLTGIKLSTTTSVSSVDAGVINIDGQSLNVGNLPANAVFTRNAEVSAYRVGINAEYPITSWLSGTGSAEVYQWRASVVDKITVDTSGYYVGYNESDSGTTPAAALGFVIKPVKGLDVVLLYRHINKITMPSLILRYSL